jgi:hypothetical protein
MKKAFDDYHLLVGSPRAGGSLWEGPDHLLLVETMPMLGFSESYKRIDYAKIETISYGRTRRFWALNILLGLLLALLITGVVAAIGDSTPLAITWGILGLIVGISLLVHAVRGPTCLCRLQTAVQVLKVKPLNRERKTRRIVARLQELCLRHQGGKVASTEELVAASAAPLAAEAFPGGARKPFTGSPLLTIALLLLLPAGAMTMAEPFVDHIAFFFGDIFLCLVAHTLAVTSLARLFRFHLPGSLKASLWGAAANLLLLFVTGYVLLITASFKQAEESIRNNKGFNIGSGHEFTMWKWMSHASFEDLGWLAWPVVVGGGLAIFFALLGLPAALRPGSAAQPPAQPPPVQPPAY